MTDFKLRYQITADSSDAKRAIADVDSRINKLGAASGGIGSSFSALAGPAAMAATGIAAVGAAALATGTALFNLTKTAADFGSQIFDASKKTGLSAETLSAMSYAADQSGSSLDNITGSISKFAKTVGAAADGSETAAKQLQALGIDPQEALNDLDGALAKVFQRIQEAPPGIEKMTLAQKAFGKSGAELLPFIDSFEGDLGGLIKRAKELGVTIDDKAAAAADAFGDQLDTLGAQMAGAGRTLGTALMPVFMQWAESTSEFLTRNQAEIARWSEGFARAINFTASTIVNNIDAFAGLGEILIGLVNYDWSKVSLGIERIGTAIANQRGAWGALTRPGQGGVQDGGGRVRSIGSDPGVMARARAGGHLRLPGDNNDADRIERERIATVKENIAIQIAEKQASTETLIQLEKQRFEEGRLNEEAYVRAIREHEVTLSQFIIAAKERELDALRDNAAEKKRLDSEIRILYSEQERDLAEYAEADAKRDKDRRKREEADHKARVQRWNERRRQMQELADREEAADAAARERSRAQYEGGMATAPGTMLGGAMGGLGVELVPMFDDASNAMIGFQERLQLVKSDINDFVGNAIGGMIEGLAQMGAAWLAGGEFSAKAALQMVSAAAFSIATQAGFKAIFEYAEGLAAAASFNYYSAGLHFAAAKTYGVVAAIAGGVGVAAGLGARAAGGGGSGSSGRDGATEPIGATGASRNTTPISRQNENTFTSGRRDNTAELSAIARAVEKLEAKIDAANPGDVFMRGMKRNRGAIGRQLVEDIHGNNKIRTDLIRQWRP